MRNIDLLQTTDAMVWAKEFVRICKTVKWTLEDIDEELMVGWFANAMGAQELSDRRKVAFMRCETCRWWHPPSSVTQDGIGDCIRNGPRAGVDFSATSHSGPQFSCCHWEGKQRTPKTP